jgi:hypothetical protein
MSSIKQLYQRFDAWARGLSRIGYAAFAGVGSALSYLLVGVLFGESVAIEAVVMGFTMAIMFYLFNPNKQK